MAGIPGHHRPPAKRRDCDDLFYSPVPKSVGGRPSEVDVGSIDALGARIRWTQPEDRVRALERLVDDTDLTVRPLHTLHPPADWDRDARGAARANADGLG